MEDAFSPEQRSVLERATSELLAKQAAEHASQMGALSAEVQQLRTAAAAARMVPPSPPPGLGGTRLVDTRMGKPPSFKGEEALWADWSFKFKAFVGAVSPQVAVLLEQAELAAHA